MENNEADYNNCYGKFNYNDYGNNGFAVYVKMEIIDSDNNIVSQQPLYSMIGIMQN